MFEFRMSLAIHREKIAEVRQTLESIGRMIRTRPGCKRYSFYVRTRENRAMMVQLWDGRNEFKAYVRSREHRVLLGAIATLCSECTVQFRGHPLNVIHSQNTTRAGA
jgi:quinol monooxygenase YgiN